MPLIPQRLLFTAALLAIGASGCVDPRAQKDGGADEADLAPTVDAAPPAGCDVAHPCGPHLRCYDGACIADNGTCATNDDCSNDSWCDCGGSDAGRAGGDGGVACGVCVPWDESTHGSWDPACRRPEFPAAEIVAPVRTCITGGGVETTPLIADLDGDGKPELIFSSTGDGFHAVHADTCIPMFETTFGFAEWNASQLAVADLDGDGVPEIIGVDRSRRVAVFSNQGELLASSPVPYGFTDGEGELGGPAIADVDGHAPPEIVQGGQVLRYAPGTMGMMGKLTEVWERAPDAPFWGSLTVLADLTGDNKPEVIAGRHVYWPDNGTELEPPSLRNLDGANAFDAVADFNGDGHPDIALVQSGDKGRRVSIYDYTNKAFLMGPLDASDPWGGAPTVADFDGDGKPELGVAGIHSYTVYSMDCLSPHKASKCDPKGGEGVLWSRPTSDTSSGSCSAAAFDLNGDGAAEVLYRDECWLRAYDGHDGKTLFAIPVPSTTGLELPVVADIDGDGHAEIIVSGNGYPDCDGLPEHDTGTPWTRDNEGVMVFADPKHTWMPARPLWNQHSYHITNINDDLSVPEHESPNWKTWNNYRAAEQGIAGKPAGLGDFTGRQSVLKDQGPEDCTQHWTLYADICNRGAGTALRGIHGAFYLDDPRAKQGAPLCTVVTAKSLLPGECQTLSCQWVKPSTFRADIWFRVDDDGKGTAPREECIQGNNVLYERDAACKNLM